MAKLSLHPNDVAALLKSYPEIEADLLAKTTAAVAENLTRRVTNEHVQEHVDRCLAALVTERTGLKSAKLAEPFLGLIHAEAKKAVNEVFDNNVTHMIKSQIVQEVQHAMPNIINQLTKELKVNLMKIMQEQLVTLLLTRP